MSISPSRKAVRGAFRLSLMAERCLRAETQFPESKASTAARHVSSESAARDVTMNYWVVIYRFAWGLLILLFIIGLVCIFLPKYQGLCELQRRKTELQTESRQTEVLTENLKIKQQQFVSDPAFVERTARETGMAKPNEIIFKFSNNHSRVSRRMPYGRDGL